MSADTAAAPQLRPLALGEIVDVSIKLVRRNWRTLCVLVLIVALPVAIINFLVTMSTTTYVPGIVSILATKKNQRLGDLAAGTIVVRERSGGRRASERGADPSFAATRFAPPEHAAVPTAPSDVDVGGLTDADAGAIRAFLDRRERLEAVARRDVAVRLADALRPKVAGPFDDLPAERFLEALGAARRGH